MATGATRNEKLESCILMERETLILAGVAVLWYLVLQTLLTYLAFKHPDQRNTGRE